jgi:hypothetical protein
MGKIKFGVRVGKRRVCILRAKGLVQTDRPPLCNIILSCIEVHNTLGGFLPPPFPRSVIIQVTRLPVKANSHRPCRSHAMPCQKGFRLCLSHLIYTVRPCLIHICLATIVPL